MKRRTFVGAAAVGAIVGVPTAVRVASGTDADRLTTERIEDIPVMWIEPSQRRAGNALAIWLNGFGGVKEQTDRYLIELARHGFVAVSFDTWQHGQRSTEQKAALIKRVFAQFRRGMWPILGQSVLETSRIIDWAYARFGLNGNVSMGGFSMGGDIAVAAAGFDHRIDCVAAIIATPDWLRPGMQDGSGNVIDQGTADRYAQFFYDSLNPMTHLDSYSHAPAISFECGADDLHVPAQAALEFQTALKATFSGEPNRMRVHLQPGVGHEVTWASWKRSLAWMVEH
jgi:dienelactone hydrolase